jgi:hypothetical protein
MMRNLERPKREKPHGAEMATGDCDGREEIRGEESGGGDGRATQSERARCLFLVARQLSAITTVQTLNVEGAVTFW